MDTKLREGLTAIRRETEVKLADQEGDISRQIDGLISDQILQSN